MSVEMQNATATSSESTSSTASEQSSQATSTQQASSTPASDSVSGAAAQPEVAGDAGQISQPAIPQYVPNHKFKVMDQEKEFDDFVKQSIKDAETEKKARELYEKAYGLDVIKPKYQRTKEEFKSLQDTWGKHQKAMEKLSKYVQMGDFGGFLSEIKIPEEAVIQWALHKQQLAQAPEDQRMAYEQSTMAQRRAMQAEMHNQELQQQIESRQVQESQQKLQTVLDRPEIKQVRQSFDARLQDEPNAFVNNVIKHARAHYDLTGEVLSEEQAVSSFIKIIGATPQAQQPMGAMNTQSQQAPVVVPPPPTIPNVSGNAQASPARKVPRSLDDIRAIRASMGE